MISSDEYGRHRGKVLHYLYENLPPREFFPRGKCFPREFMRNGRCPPWDFTGYASAAAISDDSLCLYLRLHARARYQVPDNIVIVFLCLTADNVQHDHVETSTGRRRKARGVQGRNSIHFGMNAALLHFVPNVSRLIRTRIPGARYEFDVTCVCTLSHVFELNRHKHT